MASESVDADLPKALVKRIVKAKLGAVDVAAGGDGTRDFQVNKDALLAFCESGKVFIHYLTATANDVCKEAKRQTVSAEDVLTALEDLEFGELVPALREALEAYKVEAKEKNKRKAEASKKRKADKDADGAAAGADEQPAAAAEQQQQPPEAGGGAAAGEGGGELAGAEGGLIGEAEAREEAMQIEQEEAAAPLLEEAAAA